MSGGRHSMMMDNVRARHSASDGTPASSAAPHGDLDLAA
eukprot:CAMPEP_0204175934 /NCGR_PEP_ID=MMETSP0361-20130328/47197_1 /ASSEMBLY_ACC=CAM_ASM_000343 /TAXON_ID=268821 /ORGANISM="Scrippsiella Hangoei, Strain SHTV-5" /LENGTH=38 /DNA_ID= /DNA_START= /DNA_END= /DNA_ORIENTATION=